MPMTTKLLLIISTKLRLAFFRIPEKIRVGIIKAVNTCILFVRTRG